MKTVLDSNEGLGRRIDFCVGLLVVASGFLGSVAAVRFLILP